VTDETKPPWLDLALEEYRALRSEILTTMQTQQSTLTLGTAAIGIIVARGFNVWSDPAVAAILFLFVTPFVCKLVLTIWMGEVTRMMRAGGHIHDFEHLVHANVPNLPQAVFNWETRLRAQDPNSRVTRWQRHYEWNYLAIVLMYWLIAVASIAVGWYRATWGTDDVSDTTISLVAAVTVASTVLGLALLLRQLATVCDTQGVLKPLKRKPPGARLRQRHAA
jgi:hypothetical protein